MPQADSVGKKGLDRCRVINNLNETRHDGTTAIHVQLQDLICADAILAELEQAYKTGRCVK